MKRFLSVCAGLAIVASPAFAINFYNIATVDTLTLGIDQPGSVAWNGSDLYVGSLFGSGQIRKISNPLTAPAVTATFGAPVAGNGYVSLDVGNGYVVGASNNSGVNDVVRTFDLNGNLLSQNTGGGLIQSSGSPFNRIDGASADPGWVGGGGGGAGVSLTFFGGGRRNLYSQNNLTAPLNQGVIIQAPSPVSNGWRDSNYDDATGNLYMRATQGISRYIRTGDNSFSAAQVIATFPDGTNSAINVDFLPNFDGSGTDVAIANFRSAPDTFASQIVLFDANASNVAVPGVFLNADGSAPFVAADSTNGIYDFSYDAVSRILALSDHQNGKIYFFQGTAIPEPASLSLLALGGLALLRRR